MSENHFCHTGEADGVPYHYTECGLDDIYLRSGYKIERTQYGDGVSISHVDELHDAIGHFLVTQKKILNGKEIRFLRKQMNLTQTELGIRVGVSDQQIARFEKDQGRITKSSDYLLRLSYLQHLKREVPIVDLVNSLREIDSELTADMLFFLSSDDSWQPRVAA